MSLWESCNFLPYFLQVTFVVSHEVMSDSATPWTVPLQASLSFTVSPEFA